MPGGSRHASAANSGRTGGGKRSASQSGASQASASEGRVTEVIRPVVAAIGMDLESVRVTAAGRRRLLRVVVDSDHGVSLDDAAAVSRELSAALDAAGTMGDFPYTLEVSSPGVDRPLTEPRHWRRAVGRLAKVEVADGDAVVGRVVLADAEAIILDVDGTPGRFEYARLGPGAVQVEFGRLPDLPQQPEQPEAPDGH
jgi:ribosome maturation factor RimP